MKKFGWTVNTEAGNRMKDEQTGGQHIYNTVLHL
jgi:hypothetical protein